MSLVSNVSWPDLMQTLKNYFKAPGTAVTPTEFEYLSGVTSTIQTQLNGLPGQCMAGLLTSRLIISRPSVSTVDVDADYILCGGYELSSVNLTIDIMASGANGLDTGFELSATWYHIYVIYNPTAATVAGLLSASATSPTLPSGYTESVLLGAMFNTSGSDLIDTYQRQNFVEIDNPTWSVNGGTATTPTSFDISSRAPTTATSVTGTAIIQLGNTNTRVLYLSASGLTSQVGNSTYFNLASGDWVGSIFHIPLGDIAGAQTLYYALNGNDGGATKAYIRMGGWAY